MDLNKLFRAWTLTKHEEFPAGATTEEIAAAEERLGFSIPSSLKQLYLKANGLSVLEGDLNIYPLVGNRYRGLTTATHDYREANWEVSDEILVFGDNGSESRFGIWLPDTDGSVFNHPIIQIEVDAVALAGTSLLPFLTGWTAFYLQASKAPATALKELGISRSLTFAPHLMDAWHFAELRRWADPNLPGPSSDPYQDWFDLEQLRALLGCAHSKEPARRSSTGHAPETQKNIDNWDSWHALPVGSPEWVQMGRELAREALDSGWSVGVLLYTRGLIKHNRNNPEYHSLLARALFAMARYEGCIESCQFASTLGDDSNMALEQSAKQKLREQSA